MVFLIVQSCSCPKALKSQTQQNQHQQNLWHLAPPPHAAHRSALLVSLTDWRVSAVATDETELSGRENRRASLLEHRCTGMHSGAKKNNKTSLLSMEWGSPNTQICLSFWATRLILYIHFI